MAPKNFSPFISKFNKGKTNQATSYANQIQSAVMHKYIDKITHAISKHSIPLLIILLFPLIFMAYSLFQLRDFGLMIICMIFFVLYGASWGYCIGKNSNVVGASRSV